MAERVKDSEGKQQVQGLSEASIEHLMLGPLACTSFSGDGLFGGHRLRGAYVHKPFWRGMLPHVLSSLCDHSGCQGGPGKSKHACAFPLGERNLIPIPIIAAFVSLGYTNVLIRVKISISVLTKDIQRPKCIRLSKMISTNIKISNGLMGKCD